MALQFLFVYTKSKTYSLVNKMEISWYFVKITDKITEQFHVTKIDLQRQRKQNVESEETHNGYVSLKKGPAQNISTYLFSLYKNISHFLSFINCVTNPVFPYQTQKMHRLCNMPQPIVQFTSELPQIRHLFYTLFCGGVQIQSLLWSE